MSQSNRFPVATPPVPTGPNGVRVIAPQNDTTTVDPTVGLSIDGARQEIDDAYADMAGFHNREPDEVMRLCGGHSARMAELRGRISRIDAMRREWNTLRTREIEPLIDELAKQFSVASRRQSCLEHDWRVETGAR